MIESVNLSIHRSLGQSNSTLKTFHLWGTYRRILCKEHFLVRNKRRNKRKAVVQTCFNVTTFFLSLSELSLCRFSSSAKEGGV